MVRFSDPQRRFRCCFCLHVRTGTILLGIGQIVLHLVCIAALILLALRPDLLPSSGISYGKEHSYAVISADQPTARSHVLSIILHLVPGVSDLQDSIALPPSDPDEKESSSDRQVTKPPSNVESEEKNMEKDAFFLDDHARGVRMKLYRQADSANTTKNRRHFSPYFALCLSTFSLAFCCFLVHGAVARQPTHLLPFFFLQVFDFIISLLTVVGYVSSTSDVRLWLHTKSGPMYLNSTSLTFLLLSISCMVLAFKAYCLGMVWDCYKYLMLTGHHGNTDDWTSNRVGFLPTIWGFLGAGRRSTLLRNNLNPSDQRSFGNDSDRGGAVRPPVSYDQTNDLPNYEDALKIPANAYAPPPYFCPSDSNKPSTDNIRTQNTDANASSPP
ncbi:Tetraspanning orphan receptor [Fasciola hepatica]|uniref:Tetraspanning orphan receptor n=1 Tax=Fasciola hepatica TaxID=6192 RepID=A0A4E0RBR9_FASHE|nr:Tetraspanning orphan receptor [Fasciola hepatica]